ncbi:MAG TPA: hypothetical protein VKO67_11900 [Smithellaceae bacterium]|nr:hypothetical protein [Smithellaceae bacterium]
MKRVKKILRSKSGIALITVILILSILVAAALELNRASRADVYDAANVSDAVKLYYIAKSGFYGAAALLANSKNEYDTLRDDWAHAEILSAQSKSFFPNGQFVVRIDDEQGKVPLQRLVHDGAVDENVRGLLLRLLKLPEFKLEGHKAEEMVDSIIDWIDENSDVTGQGAESSYYQSLPQPYTAKNAPLDCIEELLMIKGITREIYMRTSEKPGLAQFVTIYGSGAVNPSTAQKMILRALDERITAELADRMDEYRKAKGNNLSSVEWYKKVTGMEAITIKPELITMVKSSHFKIYSTGTADKMEQHITGVIKRPRELREPVSIVSWRQE